MNDDKTVIIVGLAATTRDTWHDYKKTYPDAEVWTLNRAVNSGLVTVDQCTRLFEMHPLTMIEDDKFDKKYSQWLHEKHPFRIIMHEAYPAIETAEEYALEDILNDLYWYITHDGDPVRYMTSTAAYMLGMAIHENFTHIIVAGFEMRTDTEYMYQRDCMYLLMGIAAGRRIRVTLPKESSMLKAKLYGYEGAQMVTRQTIERYYKYYNQALQNSVSQVNKMQGSFEADPTDEKATEINEQVFYMQRVQGALAVLQKLVAECDLEETDMELPNSLVRMEI